MLHKVLEFPTQCVYIIFGVGRCWGRSFCKMCSLKDNGDQNYNDYTLGNFIPNCPSNTFLLLYNAIAPFFFFFYKQDYKLSRKKVQLNIYYEVQPTIEYINIIPVQLLLCGKGSQSYYRHLINTFSQVLIGLQLLQALFRFLHSKVWRHKII